MTLPELVDTAKSIREGGHSSAVTTRAEKAIIQALGRPSHQHFFTMVCLWTGLVIVCGFTIVTGVLAVGASLHKIALDEKAFDRMWVTFFGSGGIVSVATLTSAWKRRAES